MTQRISSLDAGYVTGDLSIYPSAIDTADQLIKASNNSKTRLAQTLTFNGKTIIVDDTTGFPDTGVVRVGRDIGVHSDFELISYGLKTSNTFQQLQRGFAASKQGTWSPGEIFVSNAVIAESHNVLKDAIINIETNLGTVLDPSLTSLNGILSQQEIRFLAPKPLFRAFPVIGPPPLTVRFQDFTTGHIIRYLWDFGDGGTSLEQSPTHTYVSEGVYTVKLNIITSLGAQGVATKTGYIKVSQDEVTPFFYVDSLSQPYSVQTAATLGKQPKNFLFVDQTDGDIIQRNWEFGDGVRFTQNDPDIHTVDHIYSKPGTYPVTLIIIFNNRKLKRIDLVDPLVVL